VVFSITKEGARGSIVVSVVRLPNDRRRCSNNVELGEVLEGKATSLPSDVVIILWMIRCNRTIQIEL
jgi:hypothetical protein